MKIFLFQITVLVILNVSTINSAVITCKSATPPCVVSSITPVTSATESITVLGQPSTYVDSLTTSLTFDQNSTLNYVPTDAMRLFPKLYSISLTNVSLHNVVSNAFKNCGNLMSISISYNNFPTLPDDFASTCINVTTLMLYTNGIKELEENSLRGLTFMTWFYAPYNNITCIPRGLFQNTPVINSIDLSFNQISEISPDTFKGLPALSMLNLGYNRIKNLPAFDFTNTGLTGMGVMFQLTDNQIMSINPQFITKLFTSRVSNMQSTNVMLYNSNNVTTCFPSNLMYQSIYSYNWPTMNISLTECYANWRDEYQTKLSCGSNVAVETTTKKIDGGNTGHWLFGDNKNFFAIITNAMKNFTANVSFN